MNARDIIVLGILQDRDPPGGPQEHPTSDIGQTAWHLAVLSWWRPREPFPPAVFADTELTTVLPCPRTTNELESQ